MKKTVKKSPLSNQARSNLIVNQVKRTLNAKLDPMLNALTDYQTNINQGVLLLRHMQDQRTRSQVAHKRLNLLLVTPELPESTGPNAPVLEEPFLHLVKGVEAIKYAHRLSDYLTQRTWDLILVIGGTDPLPEESVSALSATRIPKAVWLSDRTGVGRTERQLVPFFDYVFTQRTAHIPAYRALYCKQCHYLPFAADPSIYFPRSVEGRYESDALLLGDVGVDGMLQEFARSDALAGKRVRVYGSGWASDELLPTVPSEEELPDYYNGARLVIHSDFSLLRSLEVAACGVFQLIPAHGGDTPPPEFGDGIIRYHSYEELCELFARYWEHVDERRLAASRALADNKYNYSYLQKAIQLLDTVFG